MWGSAAAAPRLAGRTLLSTSASSLLTPGTAA